MRSLSMRVAASLALSGLRELLGKWRSVLRPLGVLAILTVATACQRAPEVHYRITVEVDTPAGLQSWPASHKFCAARATVQEPAAS